MAQKNPRVRESFGYSERKSAKKKTRFNIGDPVQKFRMLEYAKRTLSLMGIKIQDTKNKPKIVWVTRQTPGLRGWAAIDCLVNHGNFRLIRIDKDLF
jgi:hypothetical protein